MRVGAAARHLSGARYARSPPAHGSSAHGAPAVNLEATQLAHFPSRLLLCDRGTLDGAAYVAGGTDEVAAACAAVWLGR